MKKVHPIILPALVMLLAAAAVAWAAEDAANAPEKPKRGVNCALDGKTDVRLRSMSIDLPAAEDADDGGSVSLEFALTRNDKDILRVDEEKSKVTMFTDDLGTNLMGFKGAQGDAEEASISENTEMDRDHHRISFTVDGPQAPVDRATRLMLRADVVLVCGADERSVTQEKFALKKESTAQAGPFRVKVEQVVLPLPERVPAPEGAEGKDADAGYDPENYIMQNGEAASMIVTFGWTEKEGKEIKSLKLTGKDGVEVPLEFISEDVVQDNPRKISRHFAVGRKVEEAALTATYWDRLEDVVVPIAVNTGVGF